MQIYTKISNKQIICLFFFITVVKFHQIYTNHHDRKATKMICIIKLAQKGFLSGKEHAVL